MSCPFLKRCTRLVDFKHYRVFCEGFSFPVCERYAEMRERVMWPREWGELLERR
jgi:hypothetical protein